MTVVNVSGSLGTSSGKHFFLPGLFFQAHTKHPFGAQDKRTTPIDVHYPRMEEDQITYHLPRSLLSKLLRHRVLSRGPNMPFSR